MVVWRGLYRIGITSAVLLMTFAALSVVPAGAATTTIGQLGGSPSACEAGFDAVQTSVTSGTPYTVPAGQWLVTSWSTEAGDGPAPSGSLQLEMWRPTATADQYVLVGISPVSTTTTSGTNAFSLASPIEVQGGDLLGLRNLTQDYGCAHVNGPGFTSPGPVTPTAPVPGEVRTLPPFPIPVTLNITATLHSILPELNVQKVVSGSSPNGFIERVQCTYQSGAAPFVDAALHFRPDGTPDPESTPAGWVATNQAWQLTNGSLAGGTCTATETDTGGAATVSYSCAWTPGNRDHLPIAGGCPGVSSGPSALPASVTFTGNGETGDLTITNTFPPTPPVIPPIILAPRFTA
jgi:hypothetical protein